MIIKSRKFKVDRPIKLEGEIEITIMTGISGMIISCGATKVTAKPIEEDKT